MGDIRKMRRPSPYFFFVYLKYPTCNITDNDSTRKMPQRSGRSNSLRMQSAKTAIRPPIVSEPVSPIKICAGKELYHKKPMSAPANAAAKTANANHPAPRAKKAFSAANKPGSTSRL